MENKEDGPAILSIVHKLRISDDDIGKDENGLFGLRATDRTRAMYLFRGGNIVSESVRFTTGTTRGPNRLVFIFRTSDKLALTYARTHPYALRSCPHSSSHSS